MELKDVKKLGPKGISILNSMGIYTVSDLVRNYPYRFDVIEKRSLDDENYFDKMITDGVVEQNPVISYFKKMNRLSFRLNTQERIVNVSIFNRAFMKNNIKVGNVVTVMGKYNPKTQSLIASNILLSKLKDGKEIIPVYHLTKGISSKQMNVIITNALEDCTISKAIPDSIMKKYGFEDDYLALKSLHHPISEASLKEALRTLKYEEIYTYMKKLKELNLKNKEHNSSYVKKIDDEKVNDFVKSLPFELTIDQKKAMMEMLGEMKKDVKMNRLLQGDVSSGKTIVAFILAFATFTAGFQATMMAPTEILAKQHYKNALKIFSGTDFKIGLLTGKMSQKDKKTMYEKIKNGTIDFVIGTHALINETITWHNLGLVITDEQHRFGVNQRLALKNKAVAPDVLLMSATPIPRTYALTIYGDTDISSIKTMPRGRIPIITKVVKKSALKEALNGIYEALKNENQAYVIAPMIEDDEENLNSNVNDLKRKFSLAFKNYHISMLHGKMKDEEKETVMNDFLNKKTDILIATTVVEVGVDVSNATVMVIFDANRFGLSQLHQLRGRVGRGNSQSYCYLISDKENERLKIMEETSDGYKISEADFKLRGEGDLFGQRQSGEAMFKLSDPKKDYDLFVKVRDDVNEYFKESN